MGSTTANARHTAHVHDRPSYLLAFVPNHRGNSVFRHQHHARNIHLHASRPLLHINFNSSACCAANANVVDQNIQAAKLIQGSLDELLTVLGYGHVSDTSNGFSKPFQLNHFNCPTGPVRVAVHTNNACALLSKRIAVARPLPIPSSADPAPVTMATLPANEALIGREAMPEV